MTLPAHFQAWFTAQGWAPHPYQLALLEAGSDRLLIAPTGGGKTLAGFLPSLIEIEQRGSHGLHTLYVSPLKALAFDVARNLGRPIQEIGLTIRVEDRTGDTSATRRGRQRVDPPDILLTTPESLAVMLSYPEASRIFANLSRVVMDEFHALAESKRGDQLMLCLARLRTFAPDLIATGLSATVDDPKALAAYMGGAEVLIAPSGPAPDIALLPTTTAPPWAGAGGRYAVKDVLKAISEGRSTIVFHNTRAQAELFFQALWLANDDGLPIGLHHGSLAREQRERVEAAMAAGALRGVVATGSLDLGIDWGAVDLVIQIGAPRQIKRLAQRIGRANHRFDSPSVARLVPTNRYDLIECLAAIEALEAGDLDASPRPQAPLDVLCQHILMTACSAPFDADALYAEVASSGPYRYLSRAAFDDCLAFAATGGYALRAYDRWQRLMQREGLWGLRDPRTARGIRMNLGTIVGTEMVRVKARRGGQLGEIEESFAASLRPGDTFLIGGQTVRYDRMHELVVEVTPQKAKDPKIPVFSGQTFATSLELSERVRAMLFDPTLWPKLPQSVQDWLALQQQTSGLPREGALLCESFPHMGREHLVIYGFAGRNAHQTLGLMATRQMEAEGLGPLGFLATDQALLITSLDPVRDMESLLEVEVLREHFDEWLAETSLLRRTFRNVATVSLLIQRKQIGGRKTGKQATFSSDIIYDTLRRHEPDHLLLRATRAEAQHGLLDFDRLTEMIERRPKIELHRLERVSPLAAPLLLEMGRVRLAGEGQERNLERLAAELMERSGLDGL